MHPEQPNNALKKLPPSYNLESPAALKTERTARTTLETIKEIMALLKRTIEQCRGRLPKTTYSKDLIELLFIQPYTKIEHLVDSWIAERRTASKYLRQLELLGVLTPVRIGKYTVYINHRLMDILRRT